MHVYPAPLKKISQDLRRGTVDLEQYIVNICDHIEKVEPDVQALLPEPGRKERLLKEAAALKDRYPEPAGRPVLYGIPVGVKDLLRVDGFPTRAGSSLDPALFQGPEAACVKLLRQAGALVLGKTVTTEFAYFEPGPTRNPHNLNHTPGGSSSGSAAAVAAGMCPLALGTQTMGSVTRPAAFCGIVGFKPSYDRISTAGLVYFSPSVDHLGLFTQDLAGTEIAAAVFCRDWHPVDTAPGKPVLGVPEGPYLEKAGTEARQVFEQQLDRLSGAGIDIIRLPVLEDVEALARRHNRMASAEIAAMHAPWFSRYEELYRPRTVQIIREGQEIPDEEIEKARRGRSKLRRRLENCMQEAGIDLWAAPSTRGPAPEGISATGDPAMNLPWTYAGLPTITLPTGKADNGLPLGLQLIAPFWADEKLLAWTRELSCHLG
ncbi:MAG TPA: amidase [Firmicutes bacterium]|nr:amidase [Bacillota bacterium]